MELRDFNLAPRDAFARRRCFVPAAAFYEWELVGDGKQLYAIARTDDAPLALGGIWESWRGPGEEVVRTFAIITTRPNAEMAAAQPHAGRDRPGDWPAWLGEVDADPAALLGPPPDGTLRAWPRKPGGECAHNNGPELLEPAETTDLM